MKLTLEDLEILRDSKEAMPAFIKLMESLLTRHVNKILTESIVDGDGTKLLMARASYDGMKMLIQEVKTSVDAGFKK